MSSANWPAQVELTERIAVVEVAARQFVGVAEIEHLLVGLSDLLESERLPRGVAVNALIDLTTEWPPGSVEVMEFSMRRLQWPELHDHLEQRASADPDFRKRDLAKQVLEVFKPTWPGGEIYRTYRG